MKARDTTFVYSPRRYRHLVEWIIRKGQVTYPRGMKTYEIMDAHLVIKDPRDRLIFDPARKMNIAFAAAELFQILAGEDDARFLGHFAKNILDFSENGKIGGAYGPRLFSQIPVVIDKLSKDMDTRQAVATIYRSADLDAKSHMVPCTVSLQFLIRYGQLHLITNMRSNDVVWGLTYDVFVFTMLQEMVALSLGVPLGEYHHNDGSLHFYADRDKGMAAKLVKSRYPKKMRPMTQGPGLAKDPYYVATLAPARTPFFWVELNKRIREPIIYDLLATIRFWFARKNDWEDEKDLAFKSIKDQAIKRVVKLWK